MIRRASTHGRSASSCRSFNGRNHASTCWSTTSLSPHFCSAPLLGVRCRRRLRWPPRLRPSFSATGLTAADPDHFIDSSLAAETALFKAIELELGNRRLAAFPEEDRRDFDVLLGFFMSFLQSRRARRGQSLENHFRHLLDALETPHAYQCRTEGGKTPDFVFSSCESYRDPTFPDDRLRMVGCKTKVRERHSQWLDEAARIRFKFALCVADRLTDALVRGYEDRLRFFMPCRLLDTYAEREIRPMLGLIADPISEVTPP